MFTSKMKKMHGSHEIHVMLRSSANKLGIILHTSDQTLSVQLVEKVFTDVIMNFNWFAMTCI